MEGIAQHITQLLASWGAGGGQDILGHALTIDFAIPPNDHPSLTIAHVHLLYTTGYHGGACPP